MIEVMFDEGEAGAMKAAVRKEEQLGSEVLCLKLMLDIGELRPPLSSEYRKSLYRMMFCGQWGRNDYTAKYEVQTYADFYLKQLEKVKRCVALRMPIRIWYSACPYSICGFLHLCSLLPEDYESAYAIELPTNSISENFVITRVSWNEVEPHEFINFLSLQRKLRSIEIQKFTADWNRLVKENSPLRAMVNGNITSVPVSFYDFLIRKYLGDEPIVEAELIGKILGENPLGVSDWFYASRIQHFIRIGLINIVENSKQTYRRKLRLNFSRYISRL